MKKILIVNADDCNLTRGVTEAILDCHDQGILSSATFLINLQVEAWTVRALRKRKTLGVGLHLNVTLGKPVSKFMSVRSLAGKDGFFRKVGEQLNRLPSPEEIAAEYQNQIDLFKRCFAKAPTHLDTHHQVHDRPFFFRVLREIAKHNRLPIRRSSLMLRREFSPTPRGIRTTDFFFGNFSPQGCWRETALRTVLACLPEGVSEIMCHPGRSDSDLAKISSFTHGREEEYRLFRSAEIKDWLKYFSVRLSHFGLCYT